MTKRSYTIPCKLACFYPESSSKISLPLYSIILKLLRLFVNLLYISSHAFVFGIVFSFPGCRHIIIVGFCLDLHHIHIYLCVWINYTGLRLNVFSADLWIPLRFGCAFTYLQIKIFLFSKIFLLSEERVILEATANPDFQQYIIFRPSYNLDVWKWLTSRGGHWVIFKHWKSSF